MKEGTKKTQIYNFYVSKEPTNIGLIRNASDCILKALLQPYFLDWQP